jgi:Terminase RNaseH-like domain
MTIKDLQKLIIEKQREGVTSSELARIIERIRNKPFWIWDLEEHKQADAQHNGRCCWNHVVGLPKKNGGQKPMFSYEKLLYDALLNPDLTIAADAKFKDKHVWVKKATGLGITEFFLRLMAWLSLKDDRLSGSQMVIVTGPNIDISIKLIRRLKALLSPFNIHFADKETVLELNGVRIEAYPSHHIDSARALDNVSFIFLDEADFFPIGQQADARHVSERYIAKSDPYIVMISTPNAPGGLFESIEKEPEEICIYKRVKLDYTVGLGKIYTIEEIEKAKRSPSFEREYNLRYLGRIGNTFRPADIQKAKSIQYNPDYVNPMSARSCGIDPSWGSSNFGIVITQLNNGRVEVLYAEEFERAEHSDMLEKVRSLILNKFSPITKIYVDGSQPGFIRSLKIALNEDPEYEKAIEYYNHNHMDWQANMTILPIPFSTSHKAMLSHTRTLIEDGFVAIHSTRFQKLITSLHTAVDNEGKLDKNSTSHNDIFDAFRLSLQLYQFN